MKAEVFFNKNYKTKIKNMEPLYRVILKRAWFITKKNPVLWIFGFFVIFLWNGGELQMFIDTITSIGNLVSPSGLFAINLETLLIFFAGPLTIELLIIKLLILSFAIILILFFLWIAITSEIAIIRSTILLDDKEKPKFGKELKDANIKFLPVFGLHILTKIIITSLVVFISLPLLIFIVNSTSSYRLPIAIVVWVLFLPFAMIASFVFKYAINFVVLKSETFWKSISKAWILFKTNWLISLEMAIWILIINMIFGLVALLITRVIIGPFDLLTVYWMSGGFREFFFTKVIPLLLFYMIVGSMITVFQTSAWTLLFDKIVSGKRYGKLIRIVASMSKYMSTKNQIVKTSDSDKTISDVPTIISKRRRGRPKVK